MNRTFVAAACAVCIAWSSAGALAQDGNAIPMIEIVRWTAIHLDGTTDVIYDRDDDIGSLFDIPDYQHLELDTVLVDVEITDPDWELSDDDDAGNNEEVFYRFNYPVGFQVDMSPQAPPIYEASDDFVPEDEGLAPGVGSLVVELTIDFQFQEFIGANQDRLLGFVDYDVFYFLRFAVSNSQDPPDEEIFQIEVPVIVIENPSLPPANPIPFADAGSDQIVATGSAVTLDGSRTFDAFNLGFNPDDPFVITKDQLTYTWEWISGPVRVDPAQEEQNDPEATVTLVSPGDYVYRLTVDDNVNEQPTSDTVLITVVTELDENFAPVAEIDGPSDAVEVGAMIELDGSGSSDPDADELTFRWTQINDLDDPITIADEDEYQPLSGVSESVASWQAVRPGSYRFRLLVSDGEFQDEEIVEVVVVEASSGDGTDDGATDDGTDGADGASDDDGSTADPACTAGLLPFGFLTLMLGVARARRLRR